jgi:predicted nucleotidyltransferase
MELVMPTKKEIIKVLKKNLPYLMAEYGIKRIGLFGSYAKDKATEKSDVDIIAEFDRPIGFRFTEFTEHLESLLGKKVDVLTPAGVKGIRIERIAKNILENTEYV